MSKPRFTDSHRFRRPYKPAIETDIRRTFEDARERLKENTQERAVKVRELRKKP